MYGYVSKHIVSLTYRTVWWMFTKFGSDDVFMYMRVGFSVRSTHGWITGGSKIGQ